MRTSDQRGKAPGPTGRVFDVRRFSTHDGDGIRTTVFFKGCPLRCLWCHNPEGIDFDRRPVWFAGKCIRCGRCAGAAKRGGAALTEAGVVLRPEAGEDWDAVLDACPTGALRWDSRDVTADALFEELRRDMPFFAHGGGVTLSGGDPLAQPEFAAALLARCREAGIHTAIETELCAPRSSTEAVLPLCDLIYADLKLLDPDLHARYTGADNRVILERFRALLGGELAERVIVRTPLIPGITATEENIMAIGRFIGGLYPGVRWELLNYNPLAAAKYPVLGRRYGLPEDLRRFSAEQMAAFRRTARDSGVMNVIR